MPDAVELHGVGKTFGQGEPAVDAISFAVGQGEFCTLLGPSGCGKSTTLRMIAGLELPDAGRIVIGGRDCTWLPAHRRNTAMVFQGYALFPHRNVLQNVTFGLRMRRLGTSAERRRRAAEVLALVGLGGFETRLPAQLSGGQQQRVALARAIVLRPDVLLLDEPLSALDLTLRRSMRYELKRLQSQTGLTTIYVTHDQEEAMSMSDRVVVMNRGGIEQIGTPEEVYFQPRSPFVGEFIGESNLLLGQLRRAGNGTAIQVEGGLLLPCALPDDGRPPLQEGQAVRLVLRSSDIEVLRPDATAGGDAIPGRLRQRAFVGASVRLYLEPVAGGPLLMADVPARAAAAQAAVGETLLLRWPLSAPLVQPQP